MKKALLIVVATSLLAGCSGLSFIQQDAPADTAVSPVVAPAVAPKALTQKEFVDLSASIVCLKVTASTDDAATRKAKAAALIAKSGVTESAFTAYRADLEKDAKQKEAVSYAIVGRIAELCPTGNVPAAPAPTTTAPAAAVSPEELKAPVTTDTKSPEPAVAPAPAPEAAVAAPSPEEKK